MMRVDMLEGAVLDYELEVASRSGRMSLNLMDRTDKHKCIVVLIAMSEKRSVFQKLSSPS
jgi:hypothetical protein